MKRKAPTAGLLERVRRRDPASILTLPKVSRIGIVPLPFVYCKGYVPCTDNHNHNHHSLCLPARSGLKTPWQ